MRFIFRKVKALFARFLPVPARTFHRVMHEKTEENKRNHELVMSALTEMNNMITQANHMVSSMNHMVSSMNNVVVVELKDIAMETQRVFREVKPIIAETRNLTMDNEWAIGKIRKTQDVQNEKIRTLVIDSINRSQSTLESARESVWAQIFNNTIDKSSWLLDCSFSPGRWAVGYQYLYVMYRILNEIKPQNILELGLGQSTKLIAQYTQHHPEVTHQVVEHDLEWIDFFARGYEMSANTHLVNLPLEMEAFMGEMISVYGGFAEAFAGQKFDLISIDAPFGSPSGMYARIDILELLPDCLADSFIILVDDFNRQSEKNTVEFIKEKLNEKGIDYKQGSYNGQKSLCVIASSDLAFACSL